MMMNAARVILALVFALHAFGVPGWSAGAGRAGAPFPEGFVVGVAAQQSPCCGAECACGDACPCVARRAPEEPPRPPLVPPGQGWRISELGVIAARIALVLPGLETAPIPTGPTHAAAAPLILPTGAEGRALLCIWTT